MRLYRLGVFGFALLFVALGLALIVRTALAGGGGDIGYVLGILFIALGVGRLHLLRRR